MTEMARTRFIDSVLVDPGSPSMISVSDVVAFLHAFPSTPVIPYTSMSAAAMKAIGELAPHGIAQVLIHRIDDSPSRLLDALRARQADPLARAVLVRLGPQLAQLSGRVRPAVERLFREPHAFFGVADLADTAAVNVRTLYRQFEAAGLASPRMVVLCARMLRGYLWLREPAHASSDVVHKLGFSSRQQFSRVLSRFTGVTPREVQRRPDDDGFVGRVVALLSTSAPAADADLPRFPRE
ncbi:MAG: helix-turn-helix transcriptional regulator [Gemmatimonadetes bacterium]|nr:helix-turn-helix transcriptional regulator [Gemmatimonadota bacterium]